MLKQRQRIYVHEIYFEKVYTMYINFLLITFFYFIKGSSATIVACGADNTNCQVI